MHILYAPHDAACNAIMLYIMQHECNYSPHYAACNAIMLHIMQHAMQLYIALCNMQCNFALYDAACNAIMLHIVQHAMQLLLEINLHLPFSFMKIQDDAAVSCITSLLCYMFTQDWLCRSYIFVRFHSTQVKRRHVPFYQTSLSSPKLTHLGQGCAYGAQSRYVEDCAITRDPHSLQKSIDPMISICSLFKNYLVHQYTF